MVNALDKFKKAVDKKGYPKGFAPIPEWLSTGNMGLNYIISGDLRHSIPVGRMTFFSGPQGSGKSFLLANIMREAQKKGYFIVLLDTENSIDDSFMKKIGVNTSEDAMMVIRVFSVEEATSVASELLNSTSKDDKIGLFVDSLSNLESAQEIKKFDEGDLAATQGLKEKKYKQFIKGVNNRLGERNMFAVVATHVYESQNQYGDPYKVTGGTGVQFVPSIGVWLDKSPLKEGIEAIGIRVRCKTYKTRYQQLGLKTEFDLPYDTGMDLYDGALPILEEEGVVERNSAWYSYQNADTGEIVKFQRKDMNNHINELISRYNQLKGDISEKSDEDATREAIQE